MVLLVTWSFIVPSVSSHWNTSQASSPDIQTRSSSAAWCICQTAATTNTCMMWWELKKVSSLPGNHLVTQQYYTIVMNSSHLSGMLTAPMYPPRIASRSWRMTCCVVLGAPPPWGLSRNIKHSTRIMKGAVKANLQITYSLMSVMLCYLIMMMTSCPRRC